MRKLAVVGAAAVAVALVIYVVLRTGSGSDEPPRYDFDPAHERCDLVGRVLDRAGDPMPGVQVVARILDPGPAWEARAGLTRPDGTFRASVFPPRGRWTVTAEPLSGEPFEADRPVTMSPGGRVEVVLRQPESSEPPPAPNLSGDVGDSCGRALVGVEVIVRSKDRSILGRAVTGAQGEFAMRVDAPTPLIVGLAERETEIEVPDLPFHQVHLVRPSRADAKGVITVAFEFVEPPPDLVARLRIVNSAGFSEREADLELRQGPYRFPNVPHGALDLRVHADDWAGVLEGFDFRPGNEVAVVTVGPAARLRGELERKGRVLLLTPSPTLSPLDRAFREANGSKGRVPAATREVRDAMEFDFRGLPAGNHVVRVLGPGLVVKDVPVELAPGEDLDLGTIELERAFGTVVFRLRDRQDSPELEFAYLVRLYDHRGNAYSKLTEPGPPGDVVFDGLPAGTWYYRTERCLTDKPGHRRYVNSDRRIELDRSERKVIEIDATWRY
jgi:hypothetical protein